MPQCCGKDKPLQDPDQPTAVTICQNNRWSEFCAACTGCLGNQQCIDEMYNDIFLPAWTACSQSSLSTPVPIQGKYLTALAKLARIEAVLHGTKPCGCGGAD